MIITHMRSSLLGAEEFCEQKMFLSYCLSFKEKSGFKADAGNGVHKALELLGLRKFAEQNKQKTIENEIFDKPVKASSITIDKAFELGWAHYKKLSPTFTEWSDEKTIKKYRKMYDALLNFRDGEYNPLNLDIVQPEQFFEFEIKEPWAQYEYTIGGKKLDGYLRLRGTVDLIIRNDYDGYSSLDWKTGRRVNWGIGEWFNPKVKEYADLKKDKQLLLYYYSLVKILGTYDITSIIYYLQDGGPYEFHFDEQTYILAEKMIKDSFNRINSIKSPKLTKNIGNPAENHYNKRKCGWCDFNKIWPKVSTKQTVCEHFRTEIVQLGMDKVLDKHVDVSKLSNYEGGGRQNKEKERE